MTNSGAEFELLSQLGPTLPESLTVNALKILPDNENERPWKPSAGSSEAAFTYRKILKLTRGWGVVVLDLSQTQSYRRENHVGQQLTISAFSYVILVSQFRCAISVGFRRDLHRAWL